ncbi:MAG: formimidoylglutamase [Pseudobdellovibrionaceae bacterium]
MGNHWKATDASLFFSKKDPQDPRLGDFVQSFSGSLLETSADFFLWGYPDHEGIQLNGGRVGAAEAPQAIRRVFYKMTPHVQNFQRPRILDGGDLSLELSLPDRHIQGAHRAQAATDSQIPWASLGGGHDYGYADGAGFLRSQLAQKKRPLVLNLDAHLDVRPAVQNFNSGTPFYRLLTEFEGEFDFYEIGLQPHCNSKAHWDWAISKGAKLIPLQDIESEGLLPLFQRVLQKHQGQPLWLSLDMDALTSTEAPGCSQSWTTGLRSQNVMDSMSWMISFFEWKAFSIYEVSPPLDSDLRTAKLAAQFLHHYLFLAMGKQKP